MALARMKTSGFLLNLLISELRRGWFEPTKHYTLSRHIFQPAGIIYSQEFFDGLPADLQKVVLGDRIKDQALGRKLVRDLEGELLANFREFGMTVTEPTAEQMKPFREAAKKVHAEMRDEVGGKLLDSVNAELKAFRSK